jgi:hypothetical protein
MNASSETAGTPGKQKKGSMLIPALLLPAALVLKLGLFLLLIGMLPTGLAYAFMRNKTYAVSTVAAFNFTGLFPDLLSITMQGGTLRVLADKLTDLPVWLSMYGGGALGWAVVWLSPAIAMIFFEEIYQGRLRHLENLQKKLEDEWGPKVTGEVKD